MKRLTDLLFDLIGKGVTAYIFAILFIIPALLLAHQVVELLGLDKLIEWGMLENRFTHDDQTKQKAAPNFPDTAWSNQTVMSSFGQSSNASTWSMRSAVRLIRLNPAWLFMNSSR